MVGTVGSIAQKSCLWGMRNWEVMNTSSLRRFHLETDSLGLKPTQPHSEMFRAPLDHQAEHLHQEVTSRTVMGDA